MCNRDGNLSDSHAGFFNYIPYILRGKSVLSNKYVLTLSLDGSTRGKIK